jgi:hypothetical protein
MLHTATVAICSDMHIRHINTPCGQNVGFMGVEMEAALLRYVQTDGQELYRSNSHVGVPKICKELHEESMKPAFIVCVCVC